MHNVLLQEIMTTNLYTVKYNESATAVSKLFKEHSFHHILVIDEHGSLKGIVSRTDLDKTKSGATLFRNPKKEDYDAAILSTMLVSDLMTKDVIMLQATDNIVQAYQIFKKNKLRAIPVVSKGNLAGIITPLDLLDYFFKL